MWRYVPKCIEKSKNQNIASLSENSSVEGGRAGATQNDRQKRSKFQNLKILGHQKKAFFTQKALKKSFVKF